MSRDEFNVRAHTTDIIASVNFKPSLSQREAKERFWRRYREESMFGKPSDLSELKITSLAGAPQIKKDLRHPEFRGWFFEEFEIKDRIKALAGNALDRAERILEMEGEKVSASQVRLIEIILKNGGYEPPKFIETRWADQDVQNMDEDQLRQFVALAAKKIGNEKQSDGKLGTEIKKVEVGINKGAARKLRNKNTKKR